MVNEKPYRQQPDREDNANNKRCDNKPCEETEQPPIARVASRLREVGLSTKRFIDVENGRKQSYDHTRHEPDEVTGNYGVYCGCGLVGVDVDNFSADTTRLDELPETFTVSTPHKGEHRYYRSEGAVDAAVLAATGGSGSPALSWGELYTSKYLVGPGSEIVRCGKSDCYACKRDSPGRYEIAEDRSIATVSTDEIARVIQCDSGRAESGTRQGSIMEFGGDGSAIRTPARESESTKQSKTPQTTQAKLTALISTPSDRERIWEMVVEMSESSEKEGAKISAVLDRAEKIGVARSRAEQMLRAWVDIGELRVSSADNRVVPQPGVRRS